MNPMSFFVRPTPLRVHTKSNSPSATSSPRFIAVRPLFPQLHLEDGLKLSELEAAVRGALLKRIRAVTAREPPHIEIEIEQGTVHAGILPGGPGGAGADP
jgi:hypothetical protein